MTEKDLKAALVTGGTKGIGYELAKLAADDDYNPVLVSRSEGELASVKAELEDDFGVNCKVIPGDLSEEETPERIYRELRESNYRVDLLINNAGRGQMGEFTTTDWKTDREMMHLNMDAVVHLTKLFLPGMKKRGAGKVLNVSSLAAFQPGPLMALYYATKAFVQSFSEALAEEVADKGITVTALSPGPVDTDFQVTGEMPGEEGDSSLSYELDPERVARDGYRGLMNGKRIVVPGAFISIAPQLTRFLPRSSVTKFVKKMNEIQLS
ncbi:MAG: SDR family NAD(P)-dependent oxidoreductase [Candidatus Bipolaricaulia bacterium]